jgi:hypothetical protein
MGWRREKSLAPARVQTLDCPTCNIVTSHYTNYATPSPLQKEKENKTEIRLKNHTSYKF